MRVSIILPTYNRADVLPLAIRSVLNQTHTDFELIIVDDGSTDDTPAILAAHADPRIRVIRHPVNRGVAAARNTGIAAARGEILAFIDSDDTWHETKLALQVNVLSTHPSVGAIFTEWHRVTPHESIPSYNHTCLQRFPAILQSSRPHPWLHLIDGFTLYRCLLEELPIKPSTFAMRRSAVRCCGVFDETLISSEDWDLFLRISPHLL